MTPSADEGRPGRSLRSRVRPWLLPALLVVAVVLIVAACTPIVGPTPSVPPASVAPGASAAPTVAPSPTVNPAAVPLAPAQPGTDPFSTIAWLFTPIFQALFITLVWFDQVTGSMVIAIILLTLLVRVLLIPLYRKQIVSQKRMQLLAPELKEIQRRYKGDRTKVQQATAEFYKERGVNPASGCLPLILQLVLLIPMYTVFKDGLQNFDPTQMLTVFGHQLVTITPPCDPVPVVVNGIVQPCIDSVVFGIDLSQPNTIFTTPILNIGISILAIISAGLQLIQSRMTLPPAGTASDDQNTRIQRQTMMFVPLISIFYGGFLPAGLFIYWIVSTLFSIVQQYLILGWGGMFPIFGWYPSFAKDHTPRFPVAVPAADPTKRAPTSVLTTTDERAARAASTVRPRERSGRSSRRGRRR
ncbi:MAG TPA: membrane protein insertase YidC [Patescibacteria group bacterium]|nr:membrane protein insertase YidC [Patescibacteria group bacterium]